jgi:predicted TIM-barrel fold metal-dependent hydrolase
MERMILVSADGHVSAPPSVYAEYLEVRFRTAVYDLCRENDDYLNVFGVLGRPDAEDLSVLDTRGRLASGGEFGAWDATRRLAELDAEGVAAELLLPVTQCSTTPFFSAVNRPRVPELRVAGAWAHHRWLADMMATGDGRLYGVAEPVSCLEMDEMVGMVRWAAGHGFVAATVPGATAEPGLPPLYDSYYEPYWATCDDLGLPLSVHAGWGRPIGALWDVVSAIGNTDLCMPDIVDAVSRLDLAPRLVMWQLMLGGVFDRHPNLKLVLTEMRADWLPATLARLDERFSRGDTLLAMKPSEYFERNVVVVPSSIRPSEVEMRDQIGVARMLFGMDFPHPEGTWPNTWEWLRSVFVGVPEDEVRMILGENAIAFFGLDREKLTPVAQRIGPRPNDILGAGDEIDPRLLDNFHKRSGYKRPAESIDADGVDRALDECVAGLILARHDVLERQ